MCIFLTNILQNRRKRISAKLLDDGTTHGHYTMSGNHRPASEMPFKWGGGGGGGDRLESPVETHSIFVGFFCMCCCFTVWGGQIVDIVCFIKGRCNRRVFQWTR